MRRVLWWLCIGLWCSGCVWIKNKNQAVDPWRLSGQSVRYIEPAINPPPPGKPISNEEYISILVADGFFRLADDDTSKRILRAILDSKVVVEISSPPDSGNFSFIREVNGDLARNGTGFLQFANLPLLEQRYLNLPSLRISIRFYVTSKDGAKDLAQSLGVLQQLEAAAEYQSVSSLYHIGLRLLDIDFERPLIQLDFALSLSNANQNALCDGSSDTLCEGLLLLTEANAQVRPPDDLYYGNAGLCTPKGGACEPWRADTYLVLKVKRHAVPGAGSAAKDLEVIDTELLNVADELHQPNIDALEDKVFSLGSSISAPHMRTLRGLLSLAKWMVEYRDIKQLVGDQWVETKRDMQSAVSKYNAVAYSPLLTGNEKAFVRAVCDDFARLQDLLSKQNEGLRDGDLPKCQ
jgi:hypothetical protein